jgi:CMP-N-acetylneuraminic acid synthetase
VSVIAFIPAKGTSRRFPKKNIALLDGKPLLVYAIDAAYESGIFDKIIVSSEDDEVLRTASGWRGRMVDVIRRDPSLSGDTVPVSDVCGSLLQRYECESFAVLLPTSPLRTSADIRTAWKIFNESKADVCMSLVEFGYPPQWGVTEDNDGFVCTGTHINTPRQYLPKLYRHDGSVLFVKTESFLTTPNFYAGLVMPYFMLQERVVDINTEFDLQFAEFLIRQHQERRLIN